MLIEVNLWWVGFAMVATPAVVLVAFMLRLMWVDEVARLMFGTLLAIAATIGGVIGGIELMKRHAAKPAACACDPCRCNPCDCEGCE